MLTSPGFHDESLPEGSFEVATCVAALYRPNDGQTKKQRERNFRQEALTFYNGRGSDHQRDGNGRSHMEEVWCHVTGLWCIPETADIAHIVPDFLDSEGICELLFGTQKDSLGGPVTLRGPVNALLMSRRIKNWFSSHRIVIVPVDAQEDPITRWRTDVICPSIDKTCFGCDPQVGGLNGKELTFQNDNRPAPQLLYFHFIMALIQMKCLKHPNWDQTWARYYTEEPFPEPAASLRNSILFAIATHFKSDNLDAMNSFIARHSFSGLLQLREEEVTKTAPRVREEVERVESRGKKWWPSLGK